MRTCGVKYRFVISSQAFYMFFVCLSYTIPELDVLNIQTVKGLWVYFGTRSLSLYISCRTMSNGRYLVVNYSLFYPLFAKDIDVLWKRRIHQNDSELFNTFDILTQIYKKGLTKMFEEMVSCFCLDL